MPRDGAFIRNTSVATGQAEDDLFDLIERWDRALLSAPHLSGAAYKAAHLLLKFPCQQLFAETGHLTVWPGKGVLGKLAGRHRRKLYEQVDALVRAGVLRQVCRGGGADTSQYVFQSQWLASAEAEMRQSGVMQLWEKRLPRRPKRAQSHAESGMAPHAENGMPPHAEFGRGPLRGHHTDQPRPASREARARGGSPPSASPRRARPAPRTSRGDALEKLKAFSPSAETTAFISENCASVREPHGDLHVKKYILHFLAKGRVPRDLDAGFQEWMLREEEYAERDRQRGNPLLDAALDQIRRHGGEP